MKKNAVEVIKTKWNVQHWYLEMYIQSGSVFDKLKKNMF